ncbi:uncharacterized protein BJ171DRAFT_497926 [Polychytrium aggregatum]|uniref:uncharacterized protein n=1 Tax=Polychytrium aggregatum TaxID=110093 RepID=UPI0022FDBFC7|nr:uncharacterized protein BJ171DRAFT_497926 [Polychytrium aggregatum]KAI9206468.1 hypothetical protein BJ171DRAFT_497926 [Polychytrium aggregatum]
MPPPQLPVRGRRPLSTCCGCLSLRTGSLIVIGLNWWCDLAVIAVLSSLFVLTRSRPSFLENYIELSSFDFAFWAKFGLWSIFLAYVDLVIMSLGMLGAITQDLRLISMFNLYYWIHIGLGHLGMIYFHYTLLSITCASYTSSGAVPAHPIHDIQARMLGIPTQTLFEFDGADEFCDFATGDVKFWDGLYESTVGEVLNLLISLYLALVIQSFTEELKSRMRPVHHAYPPPEAQTLPDTEPAAASSGSTPPVPSPSESATLARPDTSSSTASQPGAEKASVEAGHATAGSSSETVAA